MYVACVDQRRPARLTPGNPRERDLGIAIMQQEAQVDLDGPYPVLVPYFMKEIVEQITIQARQSKYIDQQSGVSARFSIANYRTMVASARQREPPQDGVAAASDWSRTTSARGRRQGVSALAAGSFRNGILSSSTVMLGVAGSDSLCPWISCGSDSLSSTPSGSS